MKQRRLFWQIYPAYLVVILGFVLLMSWYVFRSVHAFCIDRMEEDLQARVILIEDQMKDRDGRINEEQIEAACKRLGPPTGTRITVVLSSGKVVGDSDKDPSHMEDHSHRPEILDAIRGKVGYAIRYSETLRRDLIYVADPLKSGGKVMGVVRVAIPITAVDDALKVVYTRIGFLAAMLVLIAALVGLVVSRKISSPIEQLTAGAERFANGELDLRLTPGGSKELNELAASMNGMAAQLDERINAVVRQRQEKEAVFGSMVEGVLAVDNDERVIYLNPAAARMLGVELASVVGRSVLEVVRNVQLQTLAARALEGPGTVEADITIYAPDEMFLQVHGSCLLDTEGNRIGACVVWNDVTRIRRLEAARKDFVSNVSHELRTPITAIKGFVETLIDGSADNPAELKRFLDIIAKQTERLNTLIADILSLSRIENDNDKNLIEVKPCRVVGVIKEAMEICSLRADRKKVGIRLECDHELSAMINAPLFEQAIVNLVDNAVKYSNEGSSVEIVARSVDGLVVIQVSDHGCGIEKKHLSRIFERFYRVDEGRSRQLGGTGLGLAIVKHIAMAHSGEVSVESVPGKGSTFSFVVRKA